MVSVPISTVTGMDGYPKTCAVPGATRSGNLYLTRVVLPWWWVVTGTHTETANDTENHQNAIKIIRTLNTNHQRKANRQNATQITTATVSQMHKRRKKEQINTF